MRTSNIGALVPLLLLTVALLEWSLISLLFLIAFLVVQYNISREGQNLRREEILWFFVILLATLAILAETGFYVACSLKTEEWSTARLSWAKVIGVARFNPWKGTYFIYVTLATQLAVVLVVAIAVWVDERNHLSLRESSWRNILLPIFCFGNGTQLRNISILLPSLQLLVGASHPSWVSFPLFMCSCIGLLHWCLKTNMCDLSWCRRLILSYTALNILLLYSYQLPIHFPSRISTAAEYMGLYKASKDMGWPEIIYGVSLLTFYILLCSVIHDLEELESVRFSLARTSSVTCNEYISPLSNNNMTQHLLSSQQSISHFHSISIPIWSEEVTKGVIFQHIVINFFTYGFLVSLLALALWSFNYSSFCAFVLIIYIGYILYTFPSISSFRRLNVILLSFILLWALCTYAFNATFIVSRKDIKKDTKIWDTIGLCHYSIPGLFIFAQFFLGTLVAVGIFVNNCIWSLKNDNLRSCKDECNMEGQHEKKVLIFAIAAWCFRKSSRSISLFLIFILGVKPGLLHALYMVFFLIYLMRSTVGRRTRKLLVLLCEVHFALLYLLQLALISEALDCKGDSIRSILFQLGVSNHASLWEFLSIAVLLCFSAIQDHGIEALHSFSAILKCSPQSPFGFGFMKDGFSKSVLWTICSSQNLTYSDPDNTLQVNWITKYLLSIGQRCRETYHSCGTYIACLTILVTVYLVDPNYISFGYLFFLLVWIVGRQLVEKTRKRLWLPLLIYAMLVFILTYVLSSFPSLQMWLSRKISLYPYTGLKPGDSLFKNIWESLAILVVMQLYRYERTQTKAESLYEEIDESVHSDNGFLGFVKRFLIWHSGKILSVAVFYASISPVSLFGFGYLITLVFVTNFPKTSHFPAKLYSSCTGVLVACEYLFQILGSQFQMFPGQKHADFSAWLGFQVFEKGFCGIESGLRSKTLVLMVCTLQYNVFQWLDRMPSTLINTEKWAEPCHLFISPQNKGQREFPQEKAPLMERPKPFYQDRRYLDGDSVNIYSNTNKVCQTLPTQSCSLFSTGMVSGSMAANFETGLPGHISHTFWGRTKESCKSNKKRFLALKRERYETQLRTLKFYAKFWAENVFNLFGLEISMLTLLLASFTVLNSISLLYVLVLGLCILLSRRTLHFLWPVFFFLFSCILLLEYLALGNTFPPWSRNDTRKVRCHDCWNSSKLHYNYCTKCWLGVAVDDRQMLVTYFMVFFVASFKLRGNLSAGYFESDSYHQLDSQRLDRLVWKDISFERKGLWTWIDNFRLFFYHHLLDVVLMLVLITGTLEYDILHLGYLGFAMVSFRMRHTIMKKQNRIFNLLRLYNFTLVVLSLAFQAPFFGDVEKGTCSMPDVLYGVAGFYKYDYGFRITSRSALVDIIIFCLVGLQSYIFRSKAFDQVLNYLEAEQIDAILHAQEKRAAWKTAQLQHIREIEDRKQKRHLQVEKMKAEMSHFQNQLGMFNSPRNYSHSCLTHDVNNQERKISQLDSTAIMQKDSEQWQDIPTEQKLIKQLQHEGSPYSYDNDQGNASISRIRQILHFPKLSYRNGISPPCSVNSEGSKDILSNPLKYSSGSEITELEEPTVDMTPKPESLRGVILKRGKEQEKNRLTSAVQLIGHGVAQVHSLGNQAVANIVSFLNIEQNDLESNEPSSSKERENDSVDNANAIENSGSEHLEETFSMHSSGESLVSNEERQWFSKLSCYCWSKIRSNTDAICYSCFVLVFLWNFSLLTIIYLAVLFLYALLVNPGPSYFFWIAMLIYTELIILIQYIYQISVHHCGPKIDSHLRWEIGFPSVLTSSFVIAVLPLFIVYLSTLLQSSIKVRDGEWMSFTENVFLGKRMPYQEIIYERMHWKEKLGTFLLSVLNALKMIGRDLQRYWKSLTHGSEAPPHFVQVSMSVTTWPEDGIHPERIESGINRLLDACHKKWCKQKSPFAGHSVSRLRVESIESSPEDPNIALAVFEVIYASPLTICPAGAHYTALTPAADVAYELHRAKEFALLEEVGFPYPIVSVIAGGKREIDLYAYIFCADLVAFFLVAIFYQSMIKHNSQFLDVYQVEDQFPKEFVFVLMILFFLIVVDRIIYLCSFALGKVIYYFFILVLFTYSVTEYAWNMESKSQYNGVFALRAFYFTKAVSLSLQALQIKFGLPHKRTLYGQFLTSSVTNVNYLGFRIYRALPFLYEIRCVLDWSCTATSLTMYDWLKLEDIYASLYLVKCDITLSREKHQLGEKQSKARKFCSGICLFLVLICVIWAPMLMYSSGNPTNIANPIKDVSAQIDIKTGGGRLALYQNSLCHCLSWEDLLVAGYNLDPHGYLKTYNTKDIQLICCQADANTYWLVPPSTVKSFMKSVYEGFDIMFSWEFTRERPKGKEVVKYNPTEPVNSSGLLDVLNGTSNAVKVFNLYPRYLRVTGSGEVHKLEQTEDVVSGVSGALIMNQGAQLWWSFHHDNISGDEGCGSLRGPIAIVVSEETPQGFIGDTLSKFSIWSLYITFVLAVGRFIRLQCSDLRMRIPYENFPSCDRLIAICEDIYAARAEGELKLEELLFGTLVNIYRSPHILLEYTKEE
jgi:hypothetical protein